MSAAIPATVGERLCRGTGLRLGWGHLRPPVLRLKENEARSRSRRADRNFLAVAVGGVYLLIGPERSSGAGADLTGLLVALLDAAFFALSIVLGYTVSRTTGGVGGIGRLGAAMLVVLVFGMPAGFTDGCTCLASPQR